MMSLFGLFAGYLLLLAAGIGVTQLVMRKQARINLAEALCLSWVFGTAVLSLALWMGGMILSGVALFVAASALCVLLAAWGGWRTGYARFYVPRPRTWAEAILAVLFILQVAAVFVLSLRQTLGWDGVIIWEAKARFAFLNDYVLPAHYFQSGRGLTHPEYPLGMPYTQLWFYLWMGEPNQLWIKTIFPCFYVAGAGLLAILSARLTGCRWVGGGAAVLFFFVPQTVVGAGSATVGHVDFALSVVYLVAIGYLLLWQRGQETAGAIYAVSLAYLPWLKREGALLWGIAAVAGVGVALWRRKFWRLPALLLPGIAIVVAWNCYLRAMQADVTAEFFAVGPVALAQNAGRFVTSWGMIFSSVTDLRAWSIFWPIAVIALVWLSCRADKPQSLLLLWAVLIPILAYSSVYIFSAAYDYLLHMRLSLPRLLLHVVPVIWLAIAVAMAAPLMRVEPENR